MFDEVVRQGDRMTYRVLVRLESIPATTDVLIDYLNTYDVALERSGLVDAFDVPRSMDQGPLVAVLEQGWNDETIWYQRVDSTRRPRRVSRTSPWN